MNNLASLGSPSHYKELTPLIQGNKMFWRKAARAVLKLRTQMHPWDFTDKERQREEAILYIQQAMRDTKLPRAVKIALKVGVIREHKFSFKLPFVESEVCGA